MERGRGTPGILLTTPFSASFSLKYNNNSVRQREPGRLRHWPKTTNRPRTSPGLRAPDILSRALVPLGRRLSVLQKCEAPGRLSARHWSCLGGTDAGSPPHRQGVDHGRTCGRAVNMRSGSQLWLPLALKSLGPHRMPSLLGTPWEHRAPAPDEGGSGGEQALALRRVGRQRWSQRKWPGGLENTG